MAATTAFLAICWLPWAACHSFIAIIPATATLTATESGAGDTVVGACVIDGDTRVTTAVTGSTREGTVVTTITRGHSDGDMAAAGGGHDPRPYIGEGASVSMRVLVPLVTLVLVNLGFFVLL